MARRGKRTDRRALHPASAPDPLHSQRDMAVLLTANGYQVPTDLAALLPEPEAIPAGAIA